MNFRRSLRAAGRGSAAGAAATLAMSMVMFAAQRAHLMGQMPPQKITSGLLHRVGAAPGGIAERVTAAVAHVAFGAGAGLAFAEGLDVLGRPPSVWLGLLYGTGVWGFSYTVPIPALGIMAPPNRDRPGRPESMLVAHLVYGSALALILQ